MKTSTKLSLAAAVVALTAPYFASAENYTKSIVLDARGNAVKTKDGVCVTHDFPEENVVCKGGKMSINAPSVVYFDFARSTLNSKGKKVVAEVATALKAVGSYKVNLAGHADRVSSDAFNQKLSERRAASVKAALVAAGIDAAKISTIGYGETHNAVPTKDGKAEQLNRRVEIEITK